MKPELLNRFSDSQQIFMIKTVGGRKLKATPIFGDADYGPVKFRYSDYETIPSKSVRTADKIIDYYYSPTIAMCSGCCSIDGIKYTEGVPHGKKPVCNVDDAELVAVKHNGIIKTCCSSKKINERPSMWWPEVFTAYNGKSYKDSLEGKLEACGDALIAWGNCYAGETLPVKFGFIMEELSNFVGAKGTPESFREKTDELLLQLKAKRLKQSMIEDGYSKALAERASNLQTLSRS